MTTQPIQFYGFPLSGHAHRVELFMRLLGLSYQAVPTDLRKGDQKKPEFLAMNAFGQVPVIVDNGTVVPDSNAILVYLAKKYDANGTWLPEDPAGAAAVQRWLTVAAGPIASGPAPARLATVFGAKLNVDELIAKSHALLKVMDGELSARDFLVGNRPTIADIACYTYIAHAPEGNVSLEDYANLRKWLARIEALPGFVGMQKTNVGLMSA